MSRRQVPTESEVRIIGGRHGGRKIVYSGDLRTRPMKDRVRESLFNLIGPHMKGKHVIDLFAGTGAIGFEALSRGALSATFIEQHHPTARIIKKNGDLLGETDEIEILTGNTFIRWQQGLTLPENLPWAIFCSPPYAFYHERFEEVNKLLASAAEKAPSGSLIIVESDVDFSMKTFDFSDDWKVRDYPPARVAYLTIL